MLDKVKERLDADNMLYIEYDIAHGKQLVTAQGVKINVYNTNRVVVQGNAILKGRVEILLGLKEG